MDYLNASDALRILADRKHQDDAQMYSLWKRLTPEDHQIVKQAGMDWSVAPEGVDLEDAEALWRVMGGRQTNQGVTLANLNEPSSPIGFKDTEYQPIPNVRAVLPMNQKYSYGQRLNYNPNIPNDKLNAIASGERTQTTRNNRADTVAIRRLRPDDTVLFYNDKTGQATYGTVTGSGQVDPAIFTGSPEESRAARIAYAAPEGGNIRYANQTLFGNTQPKIIPLDKPWQELEPDKFVQRGLPGNSTTLSYQSSSPVMDITALPASHQQMIDAHLNAFSNSSYNQPSTGEGYAAYGDNELSWRKNPTADKQGAMPMLNGVDTYDPVVATWLIGNQVNPETKTTPLDIRKRQGVKSRWEPYVETEQGRQPIAVGDIPINEHGFFDFTSDHPKMQKLRELSGAGNLKWQYVDRPITSAIQNLKPGVTTAQVNDAIEWGNSTSGFYQPAITQEMLHAELPKQRQLQSIDQVLGGINREEAYQHQIGNLESREIYNKPRDLKQPGSGYENYNLAFKYANVSDQMGLNDANDQQWDKRAPRNYTAYSGGPIRYNDAGVAIGFGQPTYASDTVGYIGQNRSAAPNVRQSKKLLMSPIQFEVEPQQTGYRPNVELTQGARNYLPVSETYVSAPQYTYSKKRNIVPLQPEVADLPAMQKQQELLRQHLTAETPLPAGSMVMTTGKETYHPMSFTPGEAIPGVFEQVVDKEGNPVMQDVLDASGKPVMVKQYSSDGRLVNVPQRKAAVVPFVPARDPVFRDEQLGNAMIQVGDQLVPYAGSAGVALGKTELVRDPSVVPDAVDAIGQLERSQRNQLAQGNVNMASPTAGVGATRRAYSGADKTARQLSNAQSALAALQAVDPEMNVDTQQFDVDVNVRPGVAGNAVYDLMNRHGLSPVASGAGDYDRITASGELPVGEQVKLAQELRRTLAAEQVSDTSIADPELAHLRNQWKDERAAVMGKTADQLQKLKQLHGARRLDRVGRPAVDEGRQAINRLGNLIENANYEEQPVRQNLNFDPDDDFAMLSQHAGYHPMDKRFPRMQMSGELHDYYVERPDAPGGLVHVPSSTDTFTPTPIRQDVPADPNWKRMPLMQYGKINDYYVEPTVEVPPSNFQMQMAAENPSGFDWNPSQAEPSYTGQGRPAPGGSMSAMPRVENPWYRTKAGMLGLGGAAALGLGALAYQQMKQKQQEEDLRSQQLMAATGWR